MTDDASLLRKYVEERSEEAFRELVRRHVNLVYGAAVRRTDGDASLAEDIVQQVFSTLARNAAALRRHTLLTGWLYVATRHAASTARRTERRRKIREQEASFMDTLSSSSAETAADWSRLRPELDAVIDQLGERDRDAILLRFFESRPFAEIGATLRISEDAARMRVERALEKLRVLLVRRGVGSTSAALGLMLANQAAIAAPAGLVGTVTGGALASAGAAATAGPIVVFLSAMNISKIAATAVGILLVTAFGGAVREVYARRDADASLAAAQRENNTLLVDVRESRTRTQALERSVAGLQTSLDAARTSPPPPAPPQPREAFVDGEALMARHPEIRQLEIEHWRATTTGLYSPLFKELGLSAAQIERVKDLLTPGVRTLVTVNNQPVEISTGGDRGKAMKELRALLGEDGYKRYQQFDAVGVSAWQLTTELAGTLFDTAASLTPAQGEQMLRILTENHIRGAQFRGRPPFDWEAIAPQAERVLSAPQLAALNSYRASDEFQQIALEARLAQAPAAPKSDAKPEK